ncbi:helix-turn-helix domain-containing protein [Seongchinamella sediminis]|uniref:Helix-turn-helix domain-containing protein n=1 Tax=Seongchinamella sediminis TaxID=2283635 RepID=A0A3L7E429_9GAMM|nr:AraC family transcriptional regulator [Seongchinamella sediminis]RLQ23283.1 helix-turn-helix domain-containing protein [Seongchinamella sediminis]
MFLVRSGAIDGYEKLVKRLGANPNALLAEAGLSPAQLRNPNHYIAYSKMAELLELSAHRLDEPCFGLLMSQHQSSSVLGDLNMAVFRQPSVREAIEEANRNLYLHARGVSLDIKTRGENCELALAFTVFSSLGLDQTLQLSVGQLASFLADLLQLDQPGFPIVLRQPAPDMDDSRVDSALLSRVRFSSPFDGVRFPGSWLQRQPNFDEGSVREHLQAYLATLQERYPDNLRNQARAIIGQLLASGECSLEVIAATLDMHPRVLQLRLQEEGSSYGELLRETRLALAEQHLRHKSLSVTDLALKLGYAETSIFSRSFKQWTGLSPRQWQQRHLE